MTTPKLQLTELANGQANYLNANAALAALDQLVMPRVVDKDLSAPPGSPANGAMYIVGSSPTGSWSGKANNLAWWLTAVGAWTFLAPSAGMSVRVLDELDSSSLPKIYGYTGSAWVEQPGGGGGGASAAGPQLRTVSTDTEDITPSDAGFMVESSGTDPAVFTIGNESTAEWDFPGLAVVVHFIQTGDGALTIAGDGFSILLHSQDTAVLNGPGAVATAVRLGPDVWRLFGDLVPV